MVWFLGKRCWMRGIIVTLLLGCAWGLVVGCDDAGWRVVLVLELSFLRGTMEEDRICWKEIVVEVLRSVVWEASSI
ncbi:hypothetical protein BJ875DRAFT_453765, partial [Amylocarpus encephaloides]